MVNPRHHQGRPTGYYGVQRKLHAVGRRAAHAVLPIGGIRLLLAVAHWHTHSERLRHPRVPLTGRYHHHIAKLEHRRCQRMQPMRLYPIIVRY